jgi:hypothetical protein
MSLAGHVSRRMLDHYSHIRMDAKRAAVELLGKKPVKKDEPGKAAEQSYVTNHVTKIPTDDLPSPQVIALTMGATGIEPMTSTVSR